MDEYRVSAYTLPEEARRRRKIIKYLRKHVLPRVPEEYHRELILDYLYGRGPRTIMDSVRTRPGIISPPYHKIRTGDYDVYGNPLPGTYQVNMRINSNTGLPMSMYTDTQDNHEVYFSDEGNLINNIRGRHETFQCLGTNRLDYYGPNYSISHRGPDNTEMVLRQKKQGYYLFTLYNVIREGPRRLMWKKYEITYNPDAHGDGVVTRDIGTAYVFDQFGNKYQISKRAAVHIVNYTVP